MKFLGVWTDRYVVLKGVAMRKCFNPAILRKLGLDFLGNPIVQVIIKILSG